MKHFSLLFLLFGFTILHCAMPYPHPDLPEDPRKDAPDGVDVDLTLYKKERSAYKKTPKKQLLTLVGGSIMHVFINADNPSQLWCDFQQQRFLIAQLKEGKFVSLVHDYGDGLNGPVRNEIVARGALGQNPFPHIFVVPANSIQRPLESVGVWRKVNETKPIENYLALR